jgi:putative transposase
VNLRFTRRQWYHLLSHLFEPGTDHRDVVAIDETKLEIDGEQVYVWAAVDVDIFEVTHVDVSKVDLASTHYSFCVRRLVDAEVDRGPWYN